VGRVWARVKTFAVLYVIYGMDAKGLPETDGRKFGLFGSSAEIRGLRSSIDQLRTSDPDLADMFAVVNRDIEVLTLTFAQDNYGDSGKGGSIWSSRCVATGVVR